MYKERHKVLIISLLTSAFIVQNSSTQSSVLNFFAPSRPLEYHMRLVYPVMRPAIQFSRNRLPVHDSEHAYEYLS